MNTLFKFFLVFLCFYLPISKPANAETITGARALDKILLYLINNGALLSAQNADHELAVMFCEHFNPDRRSVCSSSAISIFNSGKLTLAEGICLAGNGQTPSVCSSSAISIFNSSNFNSGKLTFAEGICLAGNGQTPSVCSSSAISIFNSGKLTLAEGICLAGNGQTPSVCSSSAISLTSFNKLTLAEGICLAGNGQTPSVCKSSSLFEEFTIQDALLSLPSDDKSWAWDSFKNQYGNLVWACRGRQTAQFSFSIRCNDLPKHDLTWPD